MMAEITGFIQAKHIDSFQKLRVLIFFYQHLESSWTGQQIAKQLYLGDGLLIEKIIAELRTAGLVNCVAHRCKLRDEAGLRLSLQHLVNICEDPLTRQKILDQVRHIAIFSH
jgi:hypothetical protein